MTKKMKKLLSLMLAIAMVLAMNLTAFAVESGSTTPAKHTITVTNTDQDAGEHTYEAYQVFKGTYNSETKQLENLDWGDGVDSVELLDALKKDAAIGESFKDVKTVAEAAAAMSNFDEKQTKALAAVVGANLSSTKTTLQKGNDGYSATVEDGYYLIKDSDGAKIAEKDAKTRFMLQVNGDVTVEAKSETTTSEKKVDDKDDSTGKEDKTNWQDSADYDINDYVPFQLSATIAKDYDEYTVYHLTFHDKEEEGLTFQGDNKDYPIVVKVDGNAIKEGFKINTENLTDGDSFEVVFDDLKKIEAVKAGSKITVEYYSQLNENAVIGAKGNKNTMHIEYSNNPNDKQGGEKGTTPDDTVIVFTYKLDVNKVDENGKALKGATFSLWKKDLANGKTEDRYVLVKTIAGTDRALFEFKGLDAGEYKLVEDDAPKGYNKAADLTFTITADHEIKADNPALTELTVDNNKFTVEMEKGEVKPTGSISTNVENRSGSTLPSTGGMGTKIFYVLGACLAIGAAVVLVTRRKMSRQ